MSPLRLFASRLGWVIFLLVLFQEAHLFGQSSLIPGKPDRYFTDQAGVVDAAFGDKINAQLDQFERTSSNQILVAIYPALPPDTDIAQFATNAYNAWKVGQKGKDNGAILFVFVNDHKTFIVTGRGLEGALPDAICKRIVTQLLVPSFKDGHYAEGVQKGVDAMIAATRGEFKGNGSTQNDSSEMDASGTTTTSGWVVFALVILFIVSRIFFGSSLPFIYTVAGFGLNGGGGGYRGSSGGGFSGGGGNSAGGGAGGSW
jgi:uncharacterized protein